LYPAEYAEGEVFDLVQEVKEFKADGHELLPADVVKLDDLASLARGIF
jgi:hypothetical protein